MYVPPAHSVAYEDEVRAMVAGLGAGELVTVGPDGFPLATLLPVLWTGDRVTAHVARANVHWRSITDGAPALIVVTGPQAYVSPSFYPAKAEHGRVVPTWNYSSVHLRGRVTVHDDVEWLRPVVTALTERHEGREEQPWRVGDAPGAFLEGQLRGIVGLELTVEHVDAKAKLSQNRSEADRWGVVAGLRARGPGQDSDVADGVEEQLARGGARPATVGAAAGADPTRAGGRR